MHMLWLVLAALTLVVLGTAVSLHLFPIKELLLHQQPPMLLSEVMIATTSINLVLLVLTCQEIDLIKCRIVGFS